MDVASVGFVDLLRPYKRTEVAQQLGTSRKRVDAWANGQSTPPVEDLPALAVVLRLPVEVLVAAIARDAGRGGELSNAS